MRSLLMFVALSCAVVAQDRPLNVIFFLADDLGWTDLGCFGSTFYETPNLDAAAARGMRFTQAYAASPVCSPTRVSIMTGKSPARTNTTDYFGGGRRGRLLPARYDNRMALEETTLAEAFKSAGYRTGFFGKWHMGPEGFWPENQGFDVNAGGWRLGMPRAGYFAPWKNPRLDDSEKGTYLTDRLTDEAVKFLDDSASAKDPFFLYMSYYLVHTPLQAKQAVIEKYERKKKALPTLPNTWGKERKRKVRQVQEHAVYAAMVEIMDSSVGRILDHLEKLGLRDHTALVFMSDNGGLSTSEGHPTSNLPLRAGKGWMYEGGIREPMFIVWPGKTEAGTESSVPVISMDFYPTLLEMAGLPPRPDQHVDGTSLVPVLQGKDRLADRALHWHYPHYGNQGGAPSGGIRVGDHKLIEWFEDRSLELFDLAKDPGESRNLAKQRPQRTRELHRQLQAWRREVDAAMPSPNPKWRPRK